MIETIGEYTINKPSEPSLWHDIDLPAQGIALHEAIKAGIPIDIVKKITVILKLDNKEMARCLHISVSTLFRRRKAGRLSTDESDRLYGLVLVVKAAIDLFEGDREAAIKWFKSPVCGLGDRRPIDMMGNIVERVSVLYLIGRLEHGVIS